MATKVPSSPCPTTTLLDKPLASVPPFMPEHEAERIRALHRYEILDTPPDGSFDHITALAARLFSVPVAIVSLVDTDRIWFKSHHGLSVKEVAREPGLCASAILSGEVYAVTDAREDSRSMHNSLVQGVAGVRFYAGAPLKTNDGYLLGTLCILDTVPRQFTTDDEQLLAGLAAIVMDEIELRLASIRAVRLQGELLSLAAHDLKSPLTGILGFADLLPTQNEETRREMYSLIKAASEKMLRIIDELLKTTLIESGNITLKLNEIELGELTKTIVYQSQVLAQQKEQTLTLEILDNPLVRVDPPRFTEVLDNLISNAIKYSPIKAGTIVRVRVEEGMARVEVIDEGQGLTAEDQRKLFQRFARLSAIPTAGESSTGLGLAIVKMLTELHGGRVWAESMGKGKGSTFIITLPQT